MGAAVGVAVYASVFTWAGLVTTKALAFGLVYVLLWEALITGFLSGTRYLSIRSYTIGVMHGMEGSPFDGDLGIGYTTAVAGAVVVTIAFFALAVRAAEPDGRAVGGRLNGLVLRLLSRN